MSTFDILLPNAVPIRDRTPQPCQRSKLLTHDACQIDKMHHRLCTLRHAKGEGGPQGDQKSAGSSRRSDWGGSELGQGACTSVSTLGCRTQDLYGISHLPPRWRKCFFSTGDSMDMIVSKLFVEAYFPETARLGALEMLGQVYSAPKLTDLYRRSEMST